MQIPRRLRSSIDSKISRALKSDQHEGWQSFDRHPWRHPWLTQSNLLAMRGYSDQVLERVEEFCRNTNAEKLNFGFVCNIANTSYQIAKVFRKWGMTAELFLHPMDNYVMSQPGWEEFDGELPEGASTLETMVQKGVTFPSVPGVASYPLTNQPFSNTTVSTVEDLIGCVSASLQVKKSNAAAPFTELATHFRWHGFGTFSKTIDAIRKVDASFVIQAPYLALLARKPYVASHMGGDIWYECSRGDALGTLQRTAFSSANFLIASNPWSYAFARRYGMTNMIYVPTMLDDEEYSPGEPEYRARWSREHGGSFFALSTARLDDFFKGSRMAIEGFARFAARFPEARLGLLGWGTDFATYRKRLAEFGIADKVFFLPLVGKKRLIKYLRSAHCLLDQFVLGYFGFTALEAMACGLPVIMRLETEQYASMIRGGPPPVMNSASPEEICAALFRLTDSPAVRSEIGELGRKWFIVNAGSSNWGKTYVDLLTYAAAGKKFDFRDSPLHAKLTREEREYQEEELINAPPFPNYT